MLDLIKTTETNHGHYHKQFTSEWVIHSASQLKLTTIFFFFFPIPFVELFFSFQDKTFLNASTFSIFSPSRGTFSIEFCIYICIFYPEWHPSMYCQLIELGREIVWKNASLFSRDLERPKQYLIIIINQLCPTKTTTTTTRTTKQYEIMMVFYTYILFRILYVSVKSISNVGSLTRVETTWFMSRF